MSETFGESLEKNIRAEFKEMNFDINDALALSTKPYDKTISWCIAAEIALKILATEVVRLREVKG
tara:strand:- start:691 stop:885 length:195 start_codon:yes stop_codon:yes gene_type:complete